MSDGGREQEYVGEMKKTFHRAASHTFKISRHYTIAASYLSQVIHTLLESVHYDIIQLCQCIRASVHVS